MKTKENFEEGCYRTMDGTKRCVLSISYAPLILNISFHIILTNHPIRYTQLSPLDRGRKQSSAGLSKYLRLHREAGEPGFELFEGRTTLQF